MLRIKFGTPIYSALSVILFSVSGLASSQQLYRLFALAPGETGLMVSAINASGEIAGIADPAVQFGPQLFYVWSDGVLLRPGTLGGIEMDVAGMNAAGQVTGYGATAGHVLEHAFVWDGQILHDLGTFGGEWSEGVDINASGHVAGSAVNTTGYPRAFLWNGVSMQDLGTLGGEYSYALAINDKGRVVGLAENASNEQHAFLWNGTRMKDLGALSGERSLAKGINNAGQVIGDFYTIGGVNHAFLWSGGKMLDLGTLGGDDSYAVAINASGQVTGWSSTASEVVHPFLWDGTSMRDLGSLGGRNGFPSAINKAGQVVGLSEMKNGSSRAFLSNGGQPMVDLNKLIDSSDPLKQCVRLYNGVDINNRGQIAADGTGLCVSTGDAYLVAPMDYMMVFNFPSTGSSWRRTDPISIRMTLVDAKGIRISDARAASLIAAPCKVKFSAGGSQPRSPVCMKYNTTTNQFFFNWIPGATANVGATTLKVAATYTFSMPGEITTLRSREIQITQ